MNCLRKFYNLLGKSRFSQNYCRALRGCVLVKYSKAVSSGGLVNQEDTETGL